MPLVADRVKETTTTTGTGTLALLGAATGFTTFVAGVGSGVTVYYTIAGPSEWEVGIGTTGTGTLTRTTVLSSSNGGSLVTFSAGTKDVFCTYPAGKAVMTDDAATLANKTLTAPTITGTTTLNTVPYTFPSAQGAASTLLTNNGSGTLTWTASTLPTATRTRTAFTATASQTTFTVAYTVNQVDVFLNGVLLAAGDYTASNGTTIVLATGATSGDEVSVVTYTGTIGAPDANSLTGTTLASGVTASSLTSVGTLTALTTSGTTSLATTAGALSVYGVAYGFPASQGAASTVLTNNGSGTLTWTAPASGAAAAGTLTGTTLASNVTASSLTSVGTTLDVNGVKIGRGAGGDVNSTAVGVNALNAITTGTFNTAIGNSALLSATSPDFNSAFGMSALRTNTTGAANNAIGVSALRLNTTGSENVAVGWNALYTNTTASNNTAVGNWGLYLNTTGASNVAHGFEALYNNSTASNNTAVGYQALKANTTGTSNTAVGKGALDANTTASNNAAFGLDALGANTTGNSNTAVGKGALAISTTGAGNVAVGTNALSNNGVGGSNNVAVGASAFNSNTTAEAGTAIGASALSANTTGLSNTAVGYGALLQNTTGANNTAIGATAGWDPAPANTTGSNNTFIGYQATGTSATVSNEITLGNSSIATLRCQQTSITSLSDARDKTDIAPIPAGLAFVNALKPVSFVWNMRNGGKVGIPEFGFIAQDLQQVQADHVTVPNLVYDENPERLEASAGTLIPVLVKAIQELTAQNTVLAARIAALETI